MEADHGRKGYQMGQPDQMMSARSGNGRRKG
jgi:hypothetical protein